MDEGQTGKWATLTLTCLWYASVPGKIFQTCMFHEICCYNRLLIQPWLVGFSCFQKYPFSLVNILEGQIPFQGQLLNPNTLKHGKRISCILL